VLNNWKIKNNDDRDSKDAIKSVAA